MAVNSYKETNKMCEYKKQIVALAEEKSPMIIPNGDTLHAIALVENIFSHADSSVRIVCDTLEEDVYSDKSVVAAAKKFFKSHTVKLKILSQNKPSNPTDNPMVRLCAKNHDQCEVKFGDHYTRDFNNNFILMDNEGFRYELDDKEKNALASFNMPEVSKELEIKFDMLFSESQDTLNLSEVAGEAATLD